MEWVRRYPDPMLDEESEIEIRPFYEAEDLGPEFAPEFRAYEERIEAGLAKLKAFRAEAEKLKAKK